MCTSAIVPVDDQGRHDRLRRQILPASRPRKPTRSSLEDMQRERRALRERGYRPPATPHCWRCHRAPSSSAPPPQWFCSVDTFKDDACAACGQGHLACPSWGHDRMLSMIRERADWCISRQRRWGLPIPVFYCADCGKPVCTPGDHRKGLPISSASTARTSGSTPRPKELLPDGFTCPHCGGSTGFTKETDTLDGWFDSGSTHIASMELDAPGVWPADDVSRGRRPVPRLVPVVACSPASRCKRRRALPQGLPLPTAGPWTARARAMHKIPRQRH